MRIHHKLICEPKYLDFNIFDKDHDLDQTNSLTIDAAWSIQGPHTKILKSGAIVDTGAVQAERLHEKSIASKRTREGDVCSILKQLCRHAGTKEPEALEDKTTSGSLMFGRCVCEDNYEMDFCPSDNW